MVSMFHLLLKNAHWMVHHHGAEAFRSFAEVTCYEKDLEQCIPNDLRHIIEDFLNKVQYVCIKVVCICNVCLCGQQGQRMVGNFCGVQIFIDFVGSSNPQIFIYQTICKLPKPRKFKPLKITTHMVLCVQHRSNTQFIVCVDDMCMQVYNVCSVYIYVCYSTCLHMCLSIHTCMGMCVCTYMCMSHSRKVIRKGLMNLVMFAKLYHPNFCTNFNAFKLKALLFIYMLEIVCGTYINAFSLRVWLIFMPEELPNV